MTARADYPLLAAMEQKVSDRVKPQYGDALDEIDRLRTFVALVREFLSTQEDASRYQVVIEQLPAVMT